MLSGKGLEKILQFFKTNNIQHKHSTLWLCFKDYKKEKKILTEIQKQRPKERHKESQKETSQKKSFNNKNRVPFELSPAIIPFETLP